MGSKSQFAGKVITVLSAVIILVRVLMELAMRYGISDLLINFAVYYYAFFIFLALHVLGLILALFALPFVAPVKKWKIAVFFLATLHLLFALSILAI